MSASPEVVRPRAGRSAAAVLAILAVGAISYSNTLEAPFVFDDTRNIVENPFVQLTELGFRELYRAAFQGPWGRPVAFASFALNHYVGGYDPTGYHLVNIALHLLNGVLVYALALGFFARGAEAPDANAGWKALFAALVFTAHPVQTQAVTYVVQRMTELATAFCLLSLLLYVRGRQATRAPRRRALWAGVVACWLLALGSKEIAAPFPFVVWLCEWYFFRDLSRAWLRRNAPYLLVIGVLLALLAFLYLGARPAEPILESYARRDFTPWQRVWTQWRVIVFYIGLLLLPHPARLNLLHAFPVSRSPLDPITTPLALLALLGLGALAIRLARRRRVVSFGILWFLILLALESSLIPLELVFEHRLYLPMVGFALIAADLVFSLLAARRRWALALCALIVAALATASYARNRTWGDSVTLLSDVIAKNPASHRAHEGLATALAERGQIEDAIHHFRAALALRPEFAEAHNNLGITLALVGRHQEALWHLSEAVRIAPDYAGAHYNLGVALGQQGRREEAIEQLSEALRLLPSHRAARELLDFLSRSGGPGDAPGG